MASDKAAIGRATIGVLFLSTPHRGTAPGIWDNTQRSPEAFSPMIMNDIDRGSPKLVMMENEFNSGVINNLQVYTFFEQRDTFLINGAYSLVSYNTPLRYLFPIF